MRCGAPSSCSFRIHAVLSVATGLRQNDPVDLAGAPYGDETVFDVAGDQIRLAFERVSVTATARKAQDDPLIGPYPLLAFRVKISTARSANRPCSSRRAAA